MLKRIMMLAMAVALVAAFALPAGASASLWKDHAQVLAQNAQLQLTGNAKFSGGLGSVDCQTTSQLTATAGTGTGNVTQFEPDLDEANSTVTSKCKTGGFLVACQVHQVEATGLPWVVHNETTRVEITSGDIHFGLTGGFCPAQNGTVTTVNAAKGHTVTATPNQPKTVSSFTLSGNVEVHLYNGSATPFRSETAAVSGTQTILSNASECTSAPATYSLE